MEMKSQKRGREREMERGREGEEERERGVAG